MDSSPTSSSILDTLRTVEFRLGIKGYNVDEVDEYLDRAAQEAEALQENLRQLNDRLRQAGDRIVALEKEVRERRGGTGAAPPAPTPEPVVEPRGGGGGRTRRVDRAGAAPSDETLQRTLVLAQKFVDQTEARERVGGGGHGGAGRGEGACDGGRGGTERQDPRVRVAAPGA